MLRLSALALVAVSVFIVTPALAPAQESPRLEGAWVLEEVRAEDRVIADPAPAMYLVTEHHIAFVDAQSESALDFERPGEPTQAEKAAAYDAFAAVAGEYEMRGDTLVGRAYVSLDPELTRDWPDNGEPIATVRVEADTSWFDLADRPLVVKFRRADGDPLPR